MNSYAGTGRRWTHTQAQAKIELLRKQPNVTTHWITENLKKKRIEGHLATRPQLYSSFCSSRYCKDESLPRMLKTEETN